MVDISADRIDVLELDRKPIRRGDPPRIQTSGFSQNPDSRFAGSKTANLFDYAIRIGGIGTVSSRVSVANLLFQVGESGVPPASSIRSPDPDAWTVPPYFIQYMCLTER